MWFRIPLNPLKSPEKLRQTFTLQFCKNGPNNNFAELPSAKCFFLYNCKFYNCTVNDFFRVEILWATLAKLTSSILLKL